MKPLPRAWFVLAGLSAWGCGAKPAPPPAPAPSLPDAAERARLVVPVIRPERRADARPAAPTPCPAPPTDGLDVLAKPLKRRPVPAYPAAARARAIQGLVCLIVQVDARGRPTAVEIKRDPGAGLGDAAQEAVLRWRFVPALRGGETVSSAVKVRVVYRIH